MIFQRTNENLPLKREIENPFPGRTSFGPSISGVINDSNYKMFFQSTADSQVKNVNNLVSNKQS